MASQCNKAAPPARRKLPDARPARLKIAINVGNPGSPGLSMPSRGGYNERDGRLESVGGREGSLMPKKLSRRLRRRLVFLAYVLGIAVVIFLLPARLTSPARVIFTEAVGPAEEVAFQVGGDTLAAFGTLSDAFLARERDRTLEQEVGRLRNEKARLQELWLVQELRLDSVKGLRVSEFPVRALSTVVTAYDTGAMRQSITIAAGSTDGVRKGLVVCSAGAVVGEVTQVGPWRSRVTLITDADGSLPCRVSRTRGLCILQGTGGADCLVEWVERDESVQVGDVLVTSPVDQVASQRPLIPPGIPAAAVTQVERNPTDPFFLKVTAEPRVNLQRLEVVEVIIPTPAPAPAPEP